MVNLARYRPMPPSRYRVFILDECQNMSKNGQNLLLKPFEDTPEATVWIICTTEPNKILPALRSRCVSYCLKPLSYRDRELLLKRAASKAGVKRDLGPLVEQVSENHVSSPRLLLMALEKYASGLGAEESVLSSDSAVDTLSICRAVTSGDITVLRKALLDVTPEQARWVQASVSGWLRGGLLKSQKVSKRSVTGIEELTGIAPLDNTLLLHWLTAKLCKVCMGFRAR
jgi:hypothetical protein